MFWGKKKSHIRKMVLKHKHRNKILGSGAPGRLRFNCAFNFFFVRLGEGDSSFYWVHLFPSSTSFDRVRRVLVCGLTPRGHHLPTASLLRCICSRPLTTSLVLVWSLIFLFFTHKLFIWSWLIVRGNSTLLSIS